MNSGDRSPLKGALLGSVHYSPGFHAEGRWGLSAGRGGRQAFDGGGAG